MQWVLLKDFVYLMQDMFCRSLCSQRCELPYEMEVFYCTKIKLALFTSLVRAYLKQ